MVDPKEIAYNILERSIHLALAWVPSQVETEATPLKLKPPQGGIIGRDDPPRRFAAIEVLRWIWDGGFGV